MHGERIKVWSIVAESYGFLLRHPRALIRVGWLPLLALWGLNLVFQSYRPWPESVAPAELLSHATLLPLHVLAQSVVAAVVLVAWHRVVLLGEDAAVGLLGIRLGRREFGYLGIWLLLCLAFFVILLLAWALMIALGFGALLGTRTAMVTAGSLGNVALEDSTQIIILVVLSVCGGLALAFYATTRVSLVLPAMATDKQRSLGGAWQMSEGNGWRLVAASLLVMLPMQVAYLITAQVTAGIDETLIQAAAALLPSGFMLLLIVVTGTVLSLFSRQLEQASRDATDVAEAAA